MTGVPGYDFKNRALLERALTHSSYSNENSGAECNERLEFLGDSVLGMLAAEFLYKTHPKKPEGELTRMRASYVCEQNLFRAAEDLGIGGMLRLGRGEEGAGGRSRPAVLADAFEAVLAAVFLDGGLDPCRAIVREYVMDCRAADEIRDYKTLLQERVQASGLESPVYRLAGESGPEHEKIFTCEAVVGGAVAGRGEGRSKKAAEQAAAAEALKGL